jgi:predicted RNA-binding Zn-ribbon protein involved in translation (DUF1610 family)
MSKLKRYRCCKCGIIIETDDKDQVFEIPTQGKKHYYLCDVCYKESKYNDELEIEHETEEDLEED